MENKSSNTPVIVIAFSVVIIVAMICGMVIWLMQRSMAMNERLNDRLLEIRLQEAKARTETGSAPATPRVDDATQKELEAMQQQLKSAEEVIKREAEARRKAETKMAEMTTQKTAPQPTKTDNVVTTPPAPKAKPATPPQTPKPVAKPKRQAPTEIPASASRVGEDGYPINRVTLPMGNDELDWQL